MGSDTSGNMNKKLLYKSSKAFSIYAILILLLSAPLFYAITNQLYIDDADEALVLRKKEFLRHHLSRINKNDIETWNRFNRDEKIIGYKPIAGDTLFFSTYYDSLAEEMEPNRELNCAIKIEGKPYTYSARANLVETEDLIKSIALLFISIIALLLAGLWLINKKLSQNIWKPFYETLKQIEKFEIDKSAKPSFAYTDVEEFSRLNLSIEKLINKNTSIYRNQREFIENAAHELQTPLAIFQAKIDNLIQCGDFNEQQYQLLNDLNETLCRLNRLNKNLLLLSKIENDSYTERKEINVKSVLQHVYDFFHEQAAAKHIHIEKKLDSNTIIFSNPILAEILISNLFLNAIRHNVANGKIWIILDSKSLTFSNTGKPEPLNQEKLFNRFSKANSSEQGSGLGLAIAKKIADLNRWNIVYSYTNHHHSFTIQFNDRVA